MSNTAGQAKYDGQLVELHRPEDIPEIWANSPVQKLIGAINWGETIETTGKPQLLVCTCIEFRYILPIPKMYAYVIRRAGGRLVGSEFSIAYALSRGVRHLAIVGHNDCGMTKVQQNVPNMVQSLIKEGWNPERAEEFIQGNVARYAISDETTALQHEFYRLKRLFRRVQIAPLFITLEDSKLYVPKWYLDYVASGAENLISSAVGSVPDEELLSL